MFRNEPPSGIFTEAQFHGQEVPFSYNLPNLDSIKTRAPNYSQKKGKPRFEPLKKNSDPSPVSYDPKIERQSKRSRSPSFKFNQEKVSNYLQAIITRKKGLPGPTDY